MVSLILAAWKNFCAERSIDEPVPGEALDELIAKLPDFRRAYEPDGLSVDEFDSYGATVRTLRTFISSYHDLVAVLRDFMLPSPG